MEKNNKINDKTKTGNNYLESDVNSEYISIDIKSIYHILRNRKWWFIVTFIVVFCMIFSFTYFVIPESKYSIKATMVISNDNIRYQEKVNYYFPKNAYDLWLIANEEFPLNSLNYYYMDAASYISSDKVIDDAYKKTGGLFSKDTLRKTIMSEKSLDGDQLNISISYKNKDDTKKIAEAILGSFDEEKTKDFEDSYLDLLNKITDKTNSLNSEISLLLSQAESYSVEFNRKILTELKDISSNQINFYVSDYVPPDIKVKMDAANDQLTNLKEIKSNMEEYKNLYINRAVLNTNSDIIANISILKNIILSLLAGIASGMIFAFAVNYFKSK